MEWFSMPEFYPEICFQGVKTFWVFNISVCDLKRFDPLPSMDSWRILRHGQKIGNLTI